MGRSFLFDCPRCGYKAAVSGGPDRGIDFATQTIVCLDCRKLYDAVTRMKIPHSPLDPMASRPRLHGQIHFAGGAVSKQEAPLFEAVSNRLPGRGGANTRWVHFKLRCPVSARHRVKPWTTFDKCPKCNTFLDRTAMPYRLWD